MSNRSDAQLTIQTSRLVLRPPTPVDAPGYANLFNDPAAVPFIREPHESGPCAVADLMAEFAVDYRYGWAVHWTCVDARDDQFVGYVALHEPKSPNPVLSYAVVRDKRRQGFATEAIGAALAYGTTLPHVHSIVAHVHIDNEASAQLLEKLGFVELRRVELPGGLRREFRWRQVRQASLPEV